MENLIEEAKKGNLKAQNEICKSIRKDLLFHCINLTGNRDEAEDLVQESLIVMVSKIRDFNGSGNILPWVKTIARNRFIDETRKKKKRIHEPESAMDFLGIHSTPEVYDKMEREESARKIKDFMDVMVTLPPKTQEVFRLHYVEGIKHREISEMLGISEGTSKSQCHKGKEKIRESLQKIVYEN